MNKRLEGNAGSAGIEGSHGALWEVLKCMDYLSSKLEEARKASPASDDSYFRNSVDWAHAKLQKYYKLSDETPYYRAALALHPQYKLDYFEEHWRLFPKWISAAKTAIRGLYIEYLVKYTEATSSHSDDPESTSEMTVFDSFGAGSKAFLQKKRRRCVDEYDRFMLNDDIDETTEPLKWWRERQTQYPILSRLAFDLFSIPGMSSECERVFSAAKKIVTDERNQLSAETIEAVECA